MSDSYLDLLNEINGKLDKVLAAQSALAPQSANSGFLYDWTKPADRTFRGIPPGAQTPKLAAMTSADTVEAVARAKYGFDVFGNNQLWYGNFFDVAWAEVEKIKGMNQEQAMASRYKYCDPDFAIYGTLMMLWDVPGIPTTPLAPITEPFAGTIDSFLAKQFQSGGPGIG